MDPDTSSLRQRQAPSSPPLLPRPLHRPTYEENDGLQHILRRGPPNGWLCQVPRGHCCAQVGLCFGEYVLRMRHDRLPKHVMTGESKSGQSVLRIILRRLVLTQKAWVDTGQGSSAGKVIQEGATPNRERRKEEHRLKREENRTTKLGRRGHW